MTHSLAPVARRPVFPGLPLWMVVVFAGAAVGAIGSASAGTFYAQLVLPSWAPPRWLFGPVWTLLYAMMGVSAWLVWRERDAAGSRNALTLFLAQLALNSLWSWLFFHWHAGRLAFGEVVLLWTLIVATIAAFRPISRPAAWLLVPYLAWVTFASALTWACWQMNPTLLG